MSVGWIFSTCHKNWLASENVAYWFWVEDGFLITVKLGITMIKPLAATNKWSEKKWYGVFSCWKKWLWKGTEVHIYSNLFESCNNCNIWDVFQKNLIDPTPHFWTVVYISCKYVGVLACDIYVDICACFCCTCFVCPVSVEMSAAWFHDLLCSKVISSGVSIRLLWGDIYTRHVLFTPLNQDYL